jgi:hypothetical protein
MGISTAALSLTVAAALSLGLSACGAPWKVLQQSGPPSALRGVQTLGVSFDYSRVSLDGQDEESFLAGKSEEDRAKFEEVKDQADEGFMARLPEVLPGVHIQPAGGADEVTLTVQVTLLEQGKYAVFYAAPSVLKANLIFAVGGQVVDKIFVQTSVDATVYRPSILQRIGVAGYNLANAAARYFKESQTRGK